MAGFAERLYRASYKSVSEKGAEVTFLTAYSGGTVYDETVESPTTPTSEQITGVAVEVPGDPEEYETLQVIPAEPITLIFIPDIIGELPSLRSTVNWAGTVRTVARIVAYRPAGTAIGGRVILA